jgi:hypothetical protein
LRSSYKRLNMWEKHMDTLKRKMELLRIKETIDKALWEYYSEKGIDVPNWRMERDPQWWKDYLRELSGDHEENDDW